MSDAGERDRFTEPTRQELRPEVLPVTEEEMEAFRTNGVSQEELLREIDRLFPPITSLNDGPAC